MTHGVRAGGIPPRRAGVHGSLRPPAGGYTLLEVMLAVALTAVIVAVVGALFLFSFRAWQRGIDLRETQIQAAAVADALARDLREAARAGGVTVAPAVAVSVGRPVVIMAAPGGSAEGTRWILYALAEGAGELHRLAILLKAEGTDVTDSRLVGRGVRRLEITEAQGGYLVEVEVGRGGASARFRRVAAPLNP